MTADVIAPVIPPRARSLSRAGRGGVPRPMSLAVAPGVKPALCGALYGPARSTPRAGSPTVPSPRHLAETAATG